MGWFIISIVLALIAIGALTYRNRIEVPALAANDARRDGYHSSSTGSAAEEAEFARKVSGRIAIVAAILAVLSLVFSMYYSQDTGEAKVLRSFTGQIVGSDITDGASFKAPWVNLVNYDIRNQIITYVGDGSADEANGPAITAQDKDGATASIDITVRYSINPAAVGSIYREYRTQADLENRLVTNDIRSVVRNIPLQYHTSEFRLKREEAGIRMAEALTARWESEGLIVDAVDLRDIRYPANIEESLQVVQVAQNNANRAIAELEAARVDAERTRVDAQAQADADQIVRCGATTEQVQQEINGQTVTATRTIPLSGDQCQNRLNEQVLTSNYIAMLEEAAKNGNTIFVVPQNGNQILQLPAPQNR